MSERRTQAWEYRVLRPERDASCKEAVDPGGRLNELGAEGWELTDSVDYVGGGTKFLVFKRPRSMGSDRE